MAKDFRNGYQIDDLLDVIAAFKVALPELEATVEFTNQYEGNTPTVEYMVRNTANDAPEVAHSQGSHPVTGVRDVIAGAIQARLGNPQGPPYDELLNQIRNCQID